MSSTRLWLARLLPLIGIALHIFAAARLGDNPSSTLGFWLIAAMWGGLVVYGLVFHIRGDFIQRALNLGVKPGCGDELQKDKARLAYTVAYIIVLFFGGAAVALNVDVFFAETLPDAETLARAGRMMFLQMLTVLYIGAAAPTLFLGWTLSPLDRDASEGAARG